MSRNGRRRRGRAPQRMTQMSEAGSREAARSLSFMTENVAECLSDDGKFVYSVISDCPEALPLTALLLRARRLTERQARQWKALAMEFREYARRGA